MNLHTRIRQQLLTDLAQPQADEAAQLNNALRLLAKYRCQLIQNTLLQHHGATVLSGPFSGMQFVEQSAEGCHIPKLLGCYEQELHPFVMQMAQRGYTRILNIGCAEGYYAVGLKRLYPQLEVLAFDINPVAQESCRQLAARNNVAVPVGGLFTPEDFEQYTDGKTLVWCDIEGAEAELLDPEKCPALAGMDLVVELHPSGAGHTAQSVPQRFSMTHTVTMVGPGGRTPVLPAFLQHLGHLDQLLAVWEWRSAPTPWAILLAT
jgi:hypothetical protein